MRKVFIDLTNHAGLRLSKQNVPFVLKAYSIPGGYGDVLYQEKIPREDKNPQLVPIGCVSTTKMRKLTSEVN